MIRSPQTSQGFPGATQRRAFTLIELLVVIAIIGILMTVALPRIKGFGQSNAMTAATRQLLDDVALARDTALASRSDVYMVFVPPYSQWKYLNGTAINFALYSPTETNMMMNLLGNQFAAYALYSDRSVGDQPGRKTPSYLTPWRTLPSGIFIATNKFVYGLPVNYPSTPAPYPNGIPAFTNDLAFSFPTATNNSGNLVLPYIHFAFTGGLSGGQDAIIPLARGSIFYPRSASGLIASPFTPDAQENPPSNSVALYTDVRIDWLTGRAHVERQDLQ